MRSHTEETPSASSCHATCQSEPRFCDHCGFSYAFPCVCSSICGGADLGGVRAGGARTWEEPANDARVSQKYSKSTSFQGTRRPKSSLLEVRLPGFEAGRAFIPLENDDACQSLQGRATCVCHRVRV